MDVTGTGRNGSQCRRFGTKPASNWRRSRRLSRNGSRTRQHRGQESSHRRRTSLGDRPTHSGTRKRGVKTRSWKCNLLPCSGRPKKILALSSASDNHPSLRHLLSLTCHPDCRADAALLQKVDCYCDNCLSLCGKLLCSEAPRLVALRISLHGRSIRSPVRGLPGWP